MSFLFGLPCFLAQNFGSSVYLPGNAEKWLIRVFSCFSISFRLFYVCALLILRQIVYCVCVRVCSFVVLLISGSFLVFVSGYFFSFVHVNKMRHHGDLC
jgi:hypothetical protein